MIAERRRGLLLVLVVALAGAWIDESLGADLHWPGPSISYGIDGCEPETVLAIDDTATEISMITGKALRPDPFPQIVFVCSLDGNLAARGSTLRRFRSGEILEATVWINSDKQHLDTYRTVRHEFGHAPWACVIRPASSHSWLPIHLSITSTSRR